MEKMIGHILWLFLDAKKLVFERLRSQLEKLGLGSGSTSWARSTSTCRAATGKKVEARSTFSLPFLSGDFKLAA